LKLPIGIRESEQTVPGAPTKAFPSIATGLPSPKIPAPPLPFEVKIFQTSIKSWFFNTLQRLAYLICYVHAISRGNTNEVQ
jgi:hypothetical protein